jgi:dephospho-CoA kinase
MASMRIGLTGGVGSGKSTVATMLEALGAGLVDADALVHELIGPGGAAVAAVRAEFGPDAIAADGSVDRAWMRARVFSDPWARRRLEAVLHPQVHAESQARADALANSVPYVVLMIPLLVESGGWSRRVQRVLVVDCTEATQIERVCRRPGMTRATALGILAAQATRATRLAAADDVLFNELPLDALSSHVEHLHRHYLRYSH